MRNEHFDGFEKSKLKQNVFSCSLGEAKVLDIMSKPGGKANMQELTSKNLLRMYPGGTRVDSSNYDPQDAWSAGMQLVALNVQGQDQPLWINQGRFLGNGGCGYVLKPEYMRDLHLPPGQAQTSRGGSDVSLDNVGVELGLTPEPLVLSVTMIKSDGWTGGWGLEVGEPDMYCQLHMCGHKDDRTVSERAAPLPCTRCLFWSYLSRFELMSLPLRCRLCLLSDAVPRRLH